MLLLMFLFISLFASAQTDTNSTVSATDKNYETIYEKKWILEEFNGQNVKEIGFEEIPYLLFQEKNKRVLGFGGVNKFSGNLTLNNSQIVLGDFVSTKMAGPFLWFEVDFFISLGKINTYKLSEDTLILSNSENGKLMKFVAEKKSESKSKVEISGELKYEMKIF